jgi:putative DNA primase/helicase
LRQYRDQFFAEAVVRYKAGESWWDIDPGLAKEQQDLRREPDQWTEAVLHYCEGLKQVTASEILANVIDLPLKERGRLEQMRVASILKLNGWKKKDGWLHGAKVKLWLKQ